MPSSSTFILLLLVLLPSLILLLTTTAQTAKKYNDARNQQQQQYQQYRPPPRYQQQQPPIPPLGGGGRPDDILGTGIGGRGEPALHQEPAISTRVKLPQYSLGPAPFPRDPGFMDFELFGSARINMGVITVTGPLESQKGSLWSRRPLTTHALNTNWQVDLRFAVGGSPNKEYYGDGFAFWVTEERGVLGDALGGPDTWTGLAIFFDTFRNSNFAFKKHPYIYAKVSNGHDEVHYKNVVDDPVNTPGCHLPFRDSNRMATTVARITLMQGVLSVIMRPQGAVDWVQCIRMENIAVPLGGYIGVSAMTGGLVDMHNFISISTYGNIDTQPYSYAHENRLNLMPHMWEEMRESGKVAREFADWEEHDSFVEDLNWKVSPKVKSHLNDDYDDPYAAQEDKEGGEDEDALYAGDNGNFYTDYGDESAMDDISDLEELNAHAEEARKNNKRKTENAKNSKNKGDYDPEETQLIKDLDKVLKSNIIGKRIQKNHFENAQRMERIHEKLRHEMQSATDTLHRAAREIRQKEHELSERILVVGERIKVNLVNPFEQEVAQSSRNWFWPFVTILMILAWMAAFGYGKYRKYIKSHLL
jgi:hypothetical protein